MKLAHQTSSSRLILLLVALIVVSGARLLRAREASGRSPASAPRECRVFTDRDEIPHLRARNEEEAFGCLGYIHGLERPWHMDYLRRVSQGRSAEVLGYVRVRTDFLMRIMGIHARARELVGTLDPEVLARLESYSRGVNHGMKRALERLRNPVPGADRRGVYEFSDFGYLPEPWKPEDSVAVVLLMSFDQTRRTFEEKLAELERLARFGSEARRLYSEEGLPWDTSILKPGEYPHGLLPRESPSESATLDFRGFTATLGEGPPETGSNNWVVAPSRSRTGKPWVANDPHLNIARPAFWHWVHLSSDDGIDAVGATVPGIPAIASGANRDVAWALTNAYLDVTDLAFVRDDELRDETTERPWVWFRWWKLRVPVFFRTFSRTAEGDPILPLPAPEGTRLVLRWSGLHVDASDLGAFLHLMKASDARDLDSRLARARIPSFNYVFADRQGNIGYRATGRVPRRDQGSAYAVPRIALAGLTPAASHLPAEQMPAVFNPPRGFIATANNRQWPADAGGFTGSAGRFQRRGLRAFRIEERLGATPRHDFESQRAIQCDVQAPEARWMLPALLATLPKALSAEETRAIEELRAWQREGFSMRLDCRPCGVYRTWLERIYDQEKLEMGVLFRLLTEKTSRSLAPASLSRIVRESFAFAVSHAGSKSWGELHRAPFPHLAGAEYRPADPVPTPGDDFSVNLGTGKWNGRGFDHTSAPSMRMIVELGDPSPRVSLMLAGSNRDHESPRLADPASPWSRWARCEYATVQFPVDWSRVEAETVSF